MPIITETQQNTGSQSVLLEDKNKVISFSNDMDEHDINHNLRVNEYGKNGLDSTGKYFFEASQNPQSVMGKLKDTLLTKIGLHPDKDAIGARAVMALNEVNRVNASDLSDEEKGKEISAIHEDIDKYLASKGVYTRSTQNLAMNDFLFNVGTLAVGAGAVGRFGVIPFIKGLVKFSATSAALKYGVFPAMKATSMPEGQEYEYKPISLSELMGIKTQETGLKTATDVIEMGLTAGIMLTPTMIRNAKITSVVNEALPKVTELFKTRGIKIPQEGLTANYVLDMAKQSPELGTAIMQAADSLPFYKALGTRGSALIPKFNKGDTIKLSEGMAEVLRTEGEKIVLSIAGKEVIKNIADVAKDMKPIEISKPKEVKKGFDWKPRGFIESIQDEMPEFKVAGQYVPRSTDRLAIKARTLIKEDLPRAEKMSFEGTDDAAIATGAELLKYYSEMAGSAVDEISKNAYLDKAAELGNLMAKKLTDLGRSVQAASILARLTPEGQLRFAAKTIQKYNEEVVKSNSGLLGLKKKIPELTPDQAKDIIDNMNEISSMPDGEEKAIRFRDLQNYISDLVPTPLFNKIIAVWKAGLLTGVKTTGVNILANFSHAFGTEVIKDIPATAVDSVVSLLTHKRAATFTTKGTWGGIKSGFNKGIRFLKTGYDERNVISKLDYKRVNFGKSKFAKAIQVYEESVFKLMGAEDQPFYYGAKARSIAEQAKVQAINKGLKGEEANKFINDLIDNPTDEMITFAVADAETAVFQNKTMLGTAARKIQETGIGEVLVPFGKTPSAVAMQIINYSPVGFAEATRILIKGLNNENFDWQRDFSKKMGRAITGLGILALGAYLLRKGLIILDRPTNESERKMWELEGKKANSIKVGKKYRSIQVLGPAGNLLLIGAQFQNAFNKEGSPTAAISKATLGSAKSFSEQTFLTGISSAVGALTQPEREAEGFAGGLISSIIPTILKDIAVGTDTKMRRAENIPQKLIEKIPVLRQSLEPQVDILGQERMRKENFIEVLLDPTRPSTQIQEPVAQEIRRLIDAGEKISTSQLGNKEGYRILTQKQNTELWQRTGQIAYEKISALMSISGYANVSDDVKAKNIDKIFDDAKVIARAEKVIEIIQGLSGDDLKNKLSKAKKDGLLNREVFNVINKLR